MKNNYCVIMAGGIGSRFWPMSRNAKPKQFLDILGNGQSLLQQTFDRFTKICPNENILVVTNESYRKQVLKQLPLIPKENVLSEPHRKNTAPCITYATFKILEKNHNARMIVAPSDHVIENEEGFHAVVKQGLDFCKQNDVLLTIGIQPGRPDTGYGYIQFVPKADKENTIYKVKTFTEKPDLEMAKFFLQSGEFFWNAGIFIWNVNAIAAALAQYLPDVYDLFAAGKEKYNTKFEKDFVKKVYALSPNISIDYGVMEKAKNVYVLGADIGWSDLGTYGSLYEHIKHDQKQNAIVGSNVMVYDTEGCMIQVPQNKLVVLQGLKNYIVIESDDVLLICQKKDEQQIKQFVNDVKIQKGEEFI